MLTIIARFSLASVLTLAVLAGGSTVLLSQPASDGDTPFALTDDDGQSWPGAGSALFTRRTLDIQRKADERLRRFPDSPHTVGWLWQAERFDDALDVLARVVERQPARLPEALSVIRVRLFVPDESRRYRPRLQSLAATARAALSSLDRERAAKVAEALISIERGVADPSVEHDVLVDRVIADYPETEAARLLEVDRITRGGATQAQLDALDAFAAKQPGTVVAAKARYLKGFQLAHNRTSLVRGGASPDPTDSFLELLDIVADLESGRFPPCTWVNQAAQLVTGYSMFRPEFTPENARRMIAGIVRFAREHQALIAERKTGDSMRFLLTNTMARVAVFLPDGPAVMERQWASLAQAWPDPAPAKLVRAAWLAARPGSFLGPAALAPPSPTRETDIRALLAEAASSSNTAVATLALATLAEREFGDPSSASSAVAHYREYERRFPLSANRWVASLRAGQVEQALGRHEDAISTFLRAADTYAADPLTRTLALAYAGRIEEERGGFGAAARHYGMALGSWTADMGDAIALDLPVGHERRPAPDGPLVYRAGIQRAGLELRVAEIGRSLPVDGGQELERGRWLLAQGRASEATEVLREVSRRFDAVSTGAEARAVLGRARLDAAVDLATTDPARQADALKELDSLAGDPGDSAGRIAGIVAATLRMLEGDTARADDDLRRALQSMVAASRTGSLSPAGSLEADVLAIRDAVFQPLGHPTLGTRWDTPWPSALSEFVVAPSLLQVKTSDGVRRPVDVSRPPPGFTNVLFLTADDVKYLAAAVTRLGGSERRVPTAVMEVPNQPMGGARAIIEWWNRFFPTRPGHWTGVEILTYPAFSSIEFTNAERTRALVPFAVGYSGSTVVLEKVNGVWVMKELLGFWIT